VFEIGRVTGSAIELHPEPALLHTMDEFKEGASRRERGMAEWCFFIGTDDEIYGGTLPPLSPGRISPDQRDDASAASDWPRTRANIRSAPAWMPVQTKRAHLSVHRTELA
jgi:hypothetical protein